MVGNISRKKDPATLSMQNRILPSPSLLSVVGSSLTPLSGSAGAEQSFVFQPERFPSSRVFGPGFSPIPPSSKGWSRFLSWPSLLLFFSASPLAKPSRLPSLSRLGLLSAKNQKTIPPPKILAWISRPQIPFSRPSGLGMLPSGNWLFPLSISINLSERRSLFKEKIIWESVVDIFSCFPFAQIISLDLCKSISYNFFQFQWRRFS